MIMMQKSRLKHLQILPTLSCNMNCDYCYIKFAPMTQINYKMSNDTVDLIVESIRQKKLQLSDNATITFLGGEVTLCPEIIDRFFIKLHDNLKKNKYIINIQTNGLEISSLIEILRKFKDILPQINITISIDGFEKIHDFYRKDKNGNGTFKRIQKNLIMLLRLLHPSKITIQSTLTNKTKNIHNFIKTFHSYGITKFQLVPVITPPSLSHMRIKPTNYLDEYIKVIDYYFECLKKENPFTEDLISHYLYRILSLTNILTNPTNFPENICPIGVSVLAIDPKGYVYPCSMFVGFKDYCLGRIDNIDKTKVENIVRKVIQGRRKYCRNCKLINICDHGCVARNLIEKSDIAIFPKEYCSIKRNIILYIIKKLSSILPNLNPYFQHIEKELSLQYL